MIGSAYMALKFGYGNADQINCYLFDDVARFFVLVGDGFRDCFLDRGRFFSFYASFEAFFGAFRAPAPSMGAALP